MKRLFKEKVWLIMSKDRTVVAKGTPRNRTLVRVDDKENNQRFLTYSSRGRAIAGFGKHMGFYNMSVLKGWSYESRDLNDFLEAVECEMLFMEVEK